MIKIFTFCAKCWAHDTTITPVKLNRHCKLHSIDLLNHPPEISLVEVEEAEGWDPMSISDSNQDPPRPKRGKRLRGRDRFRRPTPWTSDEEDNDGDHVTA